jgi:neutral ceramidase
MLQVGFGVRDITPPPGAEIPGGLTKRLAKGALDKLLAGACVIYDGSTPVVLVGVDALFVTKATVAHARRIIEKETKIAGSSVLIGASHTHRGGPNVSCLAGDEDPAYSDKVARAIGSAANDAWHSLHAAEIGSGVGKEESIAFNRRFLIRDGREVTEAGKPGQAHHDLLVGRAGPIDPDVDVLAVRHPKGPLTGVVVHYACHPTAVGGDHFSPDYPGYLRKHLRARYGANLPVVFLLGPCGDICPQDCLSTAVEKGPEHGDLMGQKLAAETIRTIGRMKWLAEAPTAVAVEELSLPIRPEPNIEAERPPFGNGTGPKWEEVYARERKLVAEERRRAPKLNSEVQALRIGPLGIVTNGAEYFCELGLRIKRCAPFATSWVVTLANEWIGYVPTATAFAAGGYEPRTARSSKLMPDAGQRLLETALKALAKVKPQGSR